MMKKTKWISWYFFCCFCISLIFLRLFVFIPVIVNGSSMMNTFHNKEHLLMTKLSTNYNRKNIIVAENPIKKNKRIIKRVIGLPGETLKIINDKVYINNHKLKEPYVYFSNKDQSNAVKNYKKIYIPKNRVFVMGDNRYNSFDSREFGTIDINSIQGKIFTFK